MCVLILHIWNKDMFGLNECKNVEIVCKLNSLPPGVDFFCGKKAVFLVDRAWSQHWFSGSWLQAITFAIVDFSSVISY